jgi:hypothetical protein
MPESLSSATRLKKKERKKRVNQRELKPGLKSYTKETRRPPEKNQCMEKRSQKQ